MSKAVRKQLFSTLDTLTKATQLLHKLLMNGKTEDAASLLVECQDCAIAIGTQIDEVYGEDTDSVHGLEEYCELIYQMSESLNSYAERGRIYEQLCKQLEMISNAMEQELPDKVEKVFLPYKASMWDSLESVYLAAKADENCDAYCIPIPYYDKNKDGSFGEMRYEGGEYPENIEITDWQTYDFQKRIPDVIYIHNPYDQCNFVTSVHPMFYSANLKTITDELIYIPYFVLNEIEPNNQAAIDGMKHFCFLPGTVNADKVILQSENMRQIYINEYLKAAKEQGLAGEHVDRRALEKKFLGTGSPKFDKVMRARKDDVSIPPEWLPIIEKPDGSRKKIIFYNTGIAAFLKHNEKMLEKMKDALQVFEENKDEVALLWRPHPLLENTIKSMRLPLWQEYREIVDRYKAAGWGIYDDTADMDRAIVLSDAYYGDPSSVVQLYQKTGKPILIQDAEVVSH